MYLTLIGMCKTQNLFATYKARAYLSGFGQTMLSKVGTISVRTGQDINDGVCIPSGLLSLVVPSFGLLIFEKKLLAASIRIPSPE